MTSDRDHLPKVPACSRCNGRKSELEHYAGSVLPFGGQHPAALENFRTMVPGRLLKNAPLHRAIQAGMRPVSARHGDSMFSTLAVPIDGERIHELFGLIARGLLYYHFGATLAEDDIVQVTTLTASGAALYDEHLFPTGSSGVVTVRLGQDTVLYQGRQAPECELASAWRIRMYGGMWLLSESSVTDPSGSTIGVLTVPKSMSADSDGT